MTAFARSTSSPAPGKRSRSHAAATATRGASVREAFDVLIEDGLARIQVAADRLRETDDAAAVHELRVALRRLRALISLFAPALPDDDARDRVRRDLRWVQRRLGPARDWDVLILETLDRLVALQPGDEGLTALRRRAQKAQAEAYRRARRALAGDRFADLFEAAPALLSLLESSDLADTPIESFAAARLARLDEGLRALGARHEMLSAEDRHRLRIRAKKLRYGIEFCRALYPPEIVEPALDRLREMQDVLGTANDAVVGRVLLAKIREPVEDIAQERATAMVTGWNLAGIEQDRLRFPRLWAAYSALPPFPSQR